MSAITHFIPAAATDISRRERNADTTAALTSQRTTSSPFPYGGLTFLVLPNGRDDRDGLPGRTGEKGNLGVQGPQRSFTLEGKYQEL